MLAVLTFHDELAVENQIMKNVLKPLETTHVRRLKYIPMS